VVSNNVLLQGVTPKTLAGEISDLLGVKYLSDATFGRPTWAISGTVYGSERRLMLPISVSSTRQLKPRHVHFLLDTGAPTSYLSEEVCGYAPLCCAAKR
jgi:hypothetical protein